MSSCTAMYGDEWRNSAVPYVQFSSCVFSTYPYPLPFLNDEMTGMGMMADGKKKQRKRSGKRGGTENMSLPAPGLLTPNRQRQATITTATKSFAPRDPVLHIRLPLLRQSHMATTTVESVGESVSVTKSLYSVCRLTRSLLYPLSLWLSCHPSSVLTLDTAHQIYAVPRQVHKSQMHLPYGNGKYTKSVDCGVRA